MAEVINLLGVDKQTFDYALPQQWVDEMVKTVGDPRGHFVWLYEKGSFTGCPRPLTEEGIELLTRFNQLKGTQFPTSYDVVKFV